MCGFTGLYDTSGEISRFDLHAKAQAMNTLLKHRGPDSSGVWQDPDVPLVLAHMRLSILDLSEAGNQPMLSETERYVIAYNGEIYNHLDLQTEIEQRGHKFKSRCDTETILAAVELWGLNLALQKLNGMFAFSLWDRKERQLHFVRDRLGKKPLYIGWAGKTLLFGSELKAFLAHPDFKSEVNRDSLALYTRYGHIAAPHCIYENVWSLPAGFRLSLDLESLKARDDLSRPMKPYWQHKDVLEQAHLSLHKGSDTEITNEFEELLTSCVERRMVSDVPLGAFLSGGLDSSVVVALMQKFSSQPVKTYTIGFYEAGFDEAAHARKVAQHLGTDHHELYMDAKKALDIVPLLPEIYDEPFADISAIPTYLVSHFAKKDVTVVLSGDGGDEMLGGYSRHLAAPRIWNRIKFIPRPLRKMLAAGVTALPPERWDGLVKNHPQFGARLHKAAGILGQSSQEDIYQSLLSHWPQSPVLNAGVPPLLREDADWKTKGLSFAQQMMYWDSLSYLPNDILVKLDRATMANSLEARAPLLDYKIYEYAWRLPERMKIRGGQGKWLLRKVLARHVPAELFDRPKQGFSVPTGAWLRGPLKDWAETLLSERKLEEQGYFDPAAIRSVWAEHLSGKGNHAEKLWTILMFQAWHARYS